MRLSGRLVRVEEDEYAEGRRVSWACGCDDSDLSSSMETLRFVFLLEINGMHIGGGGGGGMGGGGGRPRDYIIRCLK